jgi:hypothetical protein
MIFEVYNGKKFYKMKKCGENLKKVKHAICTLSLLY